MGGRTQGRKFAALMIPLLVDDFAPSLLSTYQVGLLAFSDGILACLYTRLAGNVRCIDMRIKSSSCKADYNLLLILVFGSLVQ